MKKIKLLRILLYLFLILCVVVAFFPFVWTFLAATHTNAQVFNYNYSFRLGTNIVQNLKDLLVTTPIWNNLWNSIFIAVVYTILIIFIDAMAGYGFSQYKFKGRDTLFFICLAAMMIPAQVTMVPLYIQLSSLKLVNTSASIILTGLSSVFGVFLMRQSMMAFPRDLIEAARIDGASESHIFFKIVLPTTRSSVTSLGILTFVNQWGNYYIPLVMLNTKEKFTIPLAISVLAQPNFDINYGALMLSTCISVLPVMIFFLIFQKNFIDGMLAGAVKG